MSPKQQTFHSEFLTDKKGFLMKKQTTMIVTAFVGLICLTTNFLPNCFAEEQEKPKYTLEIYPVEKIITFFQNDDVFVQFFIRAAEGRGNSVLVTLSKDKKFLLVFATEDNHEFLRESFSKVRETITSDMAEQLQTKNKANDDHWDLGFEENKTLMRNPQKQDEPEQKQEKKSTDNPHALPILIEQPQENAEKSPSPKVESEYKGYYIGDLFSSWENIVILEMLFKKTFEDKKMTWEYRRIDYPTGTLAIDAEPKCHLEMMKVLEKLRDEKMKFSQKILQEKKLYYTKRVALPKNMFILKHEEKKTGFSDFQLVNDSTQQLENDFQQLNENLQQSSGEIQLDEFLQPPHENMPQGAVVLPDTNEEIQLASSKLLKENKDISIANEEKTKSKTNKP
jgi:hypothetical protein